MGYDLKYADPQGSVKAAADKADAAYRAQEPGWYEMPRPEYYRYSISHGEDMRSALRVCGLLDDVWPGPKFPEWNRDWSEDSPEMEAYQNEVQTIIDADSGGVIPSYKLGSNDGWLCTPAEIRRGMARGLVDEGLQQIDDRYDRAFVEWVIRSIDHGGFRVY